MNQYISNTIHNKLVVKDLQSIDFTQLKTSEFVENALSDAYQVFELFYGEAD